jgi:hypothetical protein
VRRPWQVWAVRPQWASWWVSGRATHGVGAVQHAPPSRNAEFRGSSAENRNPQDLPAAERACVPPVSDAEPRRTCSSLREGGSPQRGGAYRRRGADAGGTQAALQSIDPQHPSKPRTTRRPPHAPPAPPPSPPPPPLHPSAPSRVMVAAPAWGGRAWDGSPPFPPAPPRAPAAPPGPPQHRDWVNGVQVTSPRPRNPRTRVRVAALHAPHAFGDRFAACV